MYALIHIICIFRLQIYILFLDIPKSNIGHTVLFIAIYCQAYKALFLRLFAKKLDNICFFLHFCLSLPTNKYEGNYEDKRILHITATSHAEELKKNFGVKSLRLFGSVSRNEQKDGSDVDVCIDMEPKMFLVVRLKRFLEELLQCSVDVVRMHKHINPFLLKEIDHDGIYVIK